MDPIVTPLAPHVILIFGATGDLAHRKLLPGLLRLFQAGLMPEFRIVGISIEEIDDAEFRDIAGGACRQFARHAFGEDDWEEFSARLSYVSHADAEARLSDVVASASEEIGPGTRLLHYLAVPPSAAADVIGLLSTCELIEHARVIMEKPFGTDLASARRLNETIHEVLREEQIFRIDHFLGKEAAQNILALRFANGLFEPIWNRDHIDHIQIDVPETLGVGSRAAFYEKTGAYRDMVVTHLMQILAFVAMEPPTSLAPEPITEEKNKVFRSLRPLNPDCVVRGQYEGYTAEAGVDPELQHRDLRRAAQRDRQLALERRPLLPAHRQAHGGGGADHLDRLPRAAAEHVPGPLAGRPLRARPPHLRPRRVFARLALLLRQEAGDGDGPRQGEHAVLARRNRLSRRHPRGLRAPDPRRDGRRPHPVHDGARTSSVCGRSRRRCWSNHRR